MLRACKVFILVAVLALPGCMDDILRALYQVGPTDGEVPAPDGGIDADIGSLAQLRISSIKPDHGPFVGGTEVVISGTGFVKGATVRIGGTAVQPTQVTLLSPLSLKVVTPAGTAGPADVAVSQGSQSAVLKNGFTFDAVALDPASGPTAGGTLVTVSGSGTAFAANTTLTLGGTPMTEVSVLSATSLRARTPAGESGPADLVIQNGGLSATIKDAFSFYQAANPKSGGLGGGALKGTLTVTTLNALDRSVVPKALVVVVKDRSFGQKGLTDSTGTVVFSDTRLTGPVTVTAGLSGFESTSVLAFDARNVTLFLTPLPKPQPGPLPPGTSAGIITGHLLFGGATGVGSTAWKLVPEPKSTDQVKRAYVFTSIPYLYWGAPSYGSGASVDFDASKAATAWPFTLYGRTGAMAVCALAGLYTKSTGTFAPYAMGLTRGVVVGPGDQAKADVQMTIPLSEKVTLTLSDIPAAVVAHQMRLAVDLGADGLLLWPANEVKGDGPPQSRAFGRLPAFTHTPLIDATFSAETVVYLGPSGSAPMSSSSIVMSLPKSGELTLGGFIGVPIQVKPPAGGLLQGNTLSWAHDKGTPNLAVSVITTSDGTPVWRLFGPGALTVAKLPDPSVLGLPAWPKGTLSWTLYLAYLPGFTFDTFTYSHLSFRYWSRYAYDIFSIKVP